MNADPEEGAATYQVGYCRPPVHTRFQPGVSGNPSGRPKGTQNFRTLLERILKEEIPLIDGERHRKVSKAEAITRRLVIGALKGDLRSMSALFRLAEQTGQFEEAPTHHNAIEWVIVDPRLQDANELPGNTDVNREEP